MGARFILPHEGRRQKSDSLTLLKIVFLQMKKYFIYSIIDIIDFICGIGYLGGGGKEANIYKIIDQKIQKNNLFNKILPLFLVIILIFNNGGF